MRLKKVVSVFLCSILIFSKTNSTNITANAAIASGDIRVGLVSCYSGVSAINIENTSIILGYSSGNTYSSDITLNSSTGFRFSVDNASYYVSDTEFSSLDSAREAANYYCGLGYNAYAAVRRSGDYKLFVGETGDISELENIHSAIESAGYTFSSSVSEDGLRMKMSYDNTSIIIDASKSAAYPQFKAAYADSEGVYAIDLGDREYRGRIEIGRYGNGTLTAVNIADIEQYLYGVVPCEMVSSWNIEALKAQAVCARSYAYLTAGYTSDTIIKKGYTLVDTTASQVYRGYLAEKSSSNQAVNDTKGQMIYYNGEVVKGYYFSTSGGSTENIEDVWSTPVGYLRSVSDIYELFPEKKPWIVKLTSSEIGSKLQAAGLSVGSIKDIKVDIWTESEHAYSVRFAGSAGKESISGDKVRTALSLPATKFKIVKSTDDPDKVYTISANGNSEVQLKDSYVINSDGETVKIDSEIEQVMVLSKDNITNFPTIVPSDSNTYYFAGQGSGHSVGLSQSGAKGMADAGYDYKGILEHYYTGITVK